jgi:hypothetical protein
MTKITADHLGRGAFVYIRQSTAEIAAAMASGEVGDDEDHG